MSSSNRFFAMLRTGHINMSQRAYKARRKMGSRTKFEVSDATRATILNALGLPQSAYGQVKPEPYAQPVQPAILAGAKLVEMPAELASQPETPTTSGYQKYYKREQFPFVEAYLTRVRNDLARVLKRVHPGALADLDTSLYSIGELAGSAAGFTCLREGDEVDLTTASAEHIENASHLHDDAKFQAELDTLGLQRISAEELPRSIQLFNGRTDLCLETADSFLRLLNHAQGRAFSLPGPVVLDLVPAIGNLSVALRGNTVTEGVLRTFFTGPVSTICGTSGLSLRGRSSLDEGTNLLMDIMDQIESDPYYHPSTQEFNSCLVQLKAARAALSEVIHFQRGILDAFRGLTKVVPQLEGPLLELKLS